MPRKKISEFRAKTILAEALGNTYTGTMIGTSASWRAEVEALANEGNYVVKVDQGVKGRFKKGLVKLGRSKQEVAGDVVELEGKGFEYILVEPQLEHSEDSERYLALERQRAGTMMSWSAAGGVNVEDLGTEIRRALFCDKVATEASYALGVPVETLMQLVKSFDDNYFSFLEVNPLVVVGGEVNLLDAAVEVDSEAAVLVDERWTPADFRSFSASASLPQAEAVEELAAQSQASFRLAVLNPAGSIFLLLSGGGASVMLADEVYNQGRGTELANYGEYSGNPDADETLIYTRQILSLMLESPALKKVLVIAGGVANFTDVRATFKGVIAALEEVKADMRAQGIRVYVRRGGPYEVEGLAMMRDFLEREDLLGTVAGPEMMLSEIIPVALNELEAK